MKRFFLLFFGLAISLFGQCQQPFDAFGNRISIPLKNSDVKVTGGFWKERITTNKEVSLPYLLKLAEDPEISAVVRNFEIAAGLAEGKKLGTSWQDAWLYKVIEAASYTLANYPNKKLEKELDSLINIIVMAQAEDGYIATQTQINRRERFEMPAGHEFYTMGHLLTAGAVHYRITGKRALFDVADKCATYLYKTVKGKEEAFSEFPYNPSVIMGAVDLYRVTNNPKHLALAEFIVNLRGYNYSTDKSRPYWASEMLTEASDQNQNYKPLRMEDEVLGHAVFFTYLYSGAADLFIETGDSTLLNALDRLWHDLTEKKMYITGGISPEHKAMSSRKTSEHSREIVMGDPIHEGISGPFDLPNSTAYNETCGQIGNFMWNWRMLLATGDVKYAEIMELSIYNSILSGVELDGTGWFYTNPLAWDGHDHVLLNHDAHKRFDPGLNYICCPTNLTRTVAAYENFLYSSSESTLWIHHFAENIISAEISGYGTIELEQQTDYPWDGKVKFKIIKAPKKGSLTLKVRIPEWAENTKIVAIGKTVEGIEASTYVTLERNFRKGDKIIMDLNMEVNLLKANPKFQNLTNQVTVKRGPVVYCLESIDLDNGADIEDIMLPVNAEWNVNSTLNVLSGIPVLETTGRQLICGEKGSGAYKRITNSELQDVKIKLIPYFAWNNREEPKMRVWLPVVY